MDNKLKLPLLVLLLNCFLFLALSQTASNDDVEALNSLKDSLQINIPSWVGSDPCSGSWEGITCKNSRVVSISLPNTGLKGQLSQNIGSFSELDTLDLSYNKDLTGPLPAEIGNLKKLTKLSLVGCGFNGQIPDQIGSLPQLVFLSLNSNNFSGRIPSSIGNLANLNWLDLTENEIGGEIPVSPGLDTLLKAQHFHLGKNKFSGEVPSQLFSSGMALLHLLLDNNQLTGEIPDTIGLVQNLTLIRFENNTLSGLVPQSLNNLTNVADLILCNNKLEGPLPNLTGMSSLKYLDLSSNAFDSTDFPQWLLTMKNLTTLRMQEANLSGQIPAGFFSLPSLQYVVLSENQLNGTLNLGPNYSKKLQLIDLHSNSIGDFTQQNQPPSFTIVLESNPICYETGTTESFCKPLQISDENPQNKCPASGCSSDKSLSPMCHCAYPYTGTVTYRAPSLYDWGNSTSIEADIKQALQSGGLPVESVVSSTRDSNPFECFDFIIKIFPLNKDSFSPSEIYQMSLVLLNLSAYRPYDFYPDKIEPKQLSNSSNTALLIGVAVGGSFVLVLLLLAGVYAFRQKLRAERAISRNNPFGNWDPSKSNCGTPELKAVKQFSFKELKKCTNNFSPANDVGSGGYGKVYKGTLPSGQLIAIKRAQKESKQGGLEFKAEIELLSRVHHKNVVSLVGFCFEEGEQMLVYEFVPNGTLKDTITGKSGIRFGWHRRIKVALGAASGLAYLHEHADPPIIHRDIKSNNILLDEKLDAKVADFGLSKPILDYDKDHVTTQVKGTMGYLDPEYYISQQVTEKSDVYSFGVLMLELITGRKPIDRGKYIVKVVRNSIDKTKDMYGLHELIDRAIRDGSALNGFEKFVDLAMMCLEESGADRPPMSDVVKEIEIILHSIGLDPAADQSEPSTSSSFQHNEVSLESSHQPYSSESLYSSSEYIQKHHEHEPR
ncbi:leucine-rich repeat receptor protein kinase HPCA1 [Arachis duranensis]|uniref:non-specific serine/threonine protein kinase n=2 Tax=Arachis TaxID=3817 RepID=A0A6P4D0E8_ARADU|nr:leucine-rich repeat receptor protein kinase HPCA1 [Arachis duranensis]